VMCGVSGCAPVVGWWTNGPAFPTWKIAVLHLFPHNLTQLGDFPHLAIVEHFLGEEKLLRGAEGSADFRGKKCGAYGLLRGKVREKVRNKQAPVNPQ